MEAYRIILADDHAMFRRCVRDLLAGVNGLQIVGETGGGVELLALLKKESVEMVICGISTPNH